MKFTTGWVKMGSYDLQCNNRMIADEKSDICHHECASASPADARDYLPGGIYRVLKR